jgi:hypothetical protein
VGIDLTISQLQDNETPNEGSSAAGSSATSNDKRKKLDLPSNEDSTIIFGLTMTTKPEPPPEYVFKCFKRQEMIPGRGQFSTIKAQSEPGSKNLMVSIFHFNEDCTSLTDNASLRFQSPWGRKAGNECVSIADGEETSTAPQWGDPLILRFTIDDFEDPEEVAHMSR